MPGLLFMVGVVRACMTKAISGTSSCADSVACANFVWLLSNVRVHAMLANLAICLMPLCVAQTTMAGRGRSRSNSHDRHLRFLRRAAVQCQSQLEEEHEWVRMMLAASSSFRDSFRHTFYLSLQRPITDPALIQRSDCCQCPYLRAAVTMAAWHRDRRDQERRYEPLRPPCIDCGVPTSQLCDQCDAPRCRWCCALPADCGLPHRPWPPAQMPPATPRYCPGCIARLVAHSRQPAADGTVIPIHLPFSPQR